VPKVSLLFEKSDGTHFNLDIDSNVTVAELMRHASVEEQFTIYKLQFISSSEDPEDREVVFVSRLQDLPTDALICDYPLANSTIFIRSTIRVYLNLHARVERLAVDASVHWPLNDFREAVECQHKVSIAEDVLILLGKEVIGDRSIGDLGFVPDCMIHAGKLDVVLGVILT